MEEKKQYEDRSLGQQKKKEEFIRECREGNYTLENPRIAVDLFDAAPLTAVCYFRTEQDTRVVAKIPGRDIETTFKVAFRGYAKEHFIPIHALYAGKENPVEITVFTKDGKKRSNTLRILTGNLPERMQKIRIMEMKRDKVQPGLIFVNGNYGLPMHKTEEGRQAGQKPTYTAAFDRNGDIRWYFSDMILANVGPMNPTANGNLLVGSEKEEHGYYTQSCYEMSLLGEIIHEYVCEGMHHDVIELPEGNIVALTRKPGTEREEDYMVEFDRNTCQIVREWDAKEILPIPESAIHYRRQDTPDVPETLDWIHMNSLDYDETDNTFIFSGRNQDALVKFDASTEEVKWILTEPAEGEEELVPPHLRDRILQPVGDGFSYPSGQHKITIMPNGDILIFNNMVAYHKYRRNMGDEIINKASRAIVYRVDEEEMTVRQIWASDWRTGVEGNSAVMGNADYLGVGHYWVNYSATMFMNDGSQTQGYWDFAVAPVQNCLFVEYLNDEIVFKARYDGNFGNCYRSHVMMPYLTKEEWG